MYCKQNMFGEIKKHTLAIYACLLAINRRVTKDTIMDSKSLKK